MRLILTLVVLINASLVMADSTTQSNTVGVSLERIVSDSFKLRWRSFSQLPVGADVDGFIVVGVTNKSDKQHASDGATGGDAWEITLGRGDKTFTLVQGRDVLFREYVVHLRCLSDGSKLLLRCGEVFDIDKRPFRVLEVDTKNRTCTILDVQRDERFTLKEQRSQTRVDAGSNSANRVNVVQAPLQD